MTPSGVSSSLSFVVNSPKYRYINLDRASLGRIACREIVPHPPGNCLFNNTLLAALPTENVLYFFYYKKLLEM